MSSLCLYNFDNILKKGFDYKMSLIYKLLLWLNSYVDKPPMYGIYHLAWIIGLIILCIVFVIISKKHKNDKLFKTTLLVCWIILIVLELIKELLGGFSVDVNNKAYFEYNFQYFPFQLCSLPFYVLPFIIFLKNEKVKQYFVAPTVSFILLGGLLFFLIPAGFKNNLYINFHTMAHHFLQVFTSFVTIIWYKDKMSFKNFFKCILPLTIGMGLSIILNIVIYKTTGVPIQLWNLSPLVIFDLSILESIRDKVGYIVYVLLYYVIIITLSLGVYMIPLLFKNKKIAEK